VNRPRHPKRYRQQVVLVYRFGPERAAFIVCAGGSNDPAGLNLPVSGSRSLPARQVTAVEGGDPLRLLVVGLCFERFTDIVSTVAAGEVKAPMGKLSQMDLFAAAVRCPRGNAVNVT